MTLSPDSLRDLARKGALVRLAEILDEQAFIRREFPELANGHVESRPASRQPARATAPTKKRPGGTRKVPIFTSEEQRLKYEAASARMRKAWKTRRKHERAAHAGPGA